MLQTRTDLPMACHPSEYRLELIDQALEAGALDFAEQQRALIDLSDADQKRLDLRIAIERQSPDALARVEARVLEGLQDPTDSLLLDSAFALLDHSPALGILVARGSISARRLFDSEALLDEVDRARDRLGLPPDEPWWDVFDQLLQNGTAQTSATHAMELEGEVQHLRKELQTANARASRLDQELATGIARLDALTAQQTAAAPQKADHARRDDTNRVSELEEERRRLRSKIEELKGEIREGAVQRSGLRRELARTADARHQSSSVPASLRTIDVEPDDGEGTATETRPRRILVPQFSSTASHALQRIPAHIASAALREAAQLAAGDELAWSNARHMRRAHEILSIRLSREYRLLFRVGEDRLEVVEIVHRRELENTIARLART